MSFSLSVANNSASQKGRYFFDSVLGVGSFGTVFCANDSQHNQQVAIKIVKVRESVLDVILRRKKAQEKLVEAMQEVDILVQLIHPNIVALKEFFEFKVGVIGGEMGIAMVMEFCAKGNLQEYLGKLAASHQLVQESQRKLWYSQLAQAIQFIHCKGIIHRDLKPANILLDNGENIKVADVGLAKTVWEAKSYCKDLSTDTTFNKYMSSLTGTPIYMAPEVWNEHYTMASDVYSLGLISVMIAVVTNPPIPYAHWEQNDDCLGKLQNEHSLCRDVLPTKLLNVSLDHVSAVENDLLNNMLKYNYHERLSIDQVLDAIDNIDKMKTQQLKQEEEANSDSTGYSCIIL